MERQGLTVEIARRWADISGEKEMEKQDLTVKIARRRADSSGEKEMEKQGLIIEIARRRPDISGEKTGIDGGPYWWFARQSCWGQNNEIFIISE